MHDHTNTKDQICKLLIVSVVYYQVEISAMVQSFVQRSPTECGVSECDRGSSQRTRRSAKDVEPREGVYIYIYSIKNVRTL